MLSLLITESYEQWVLIKLNGGVDFVKIVLVLVSI